MQKEKIIQVLDRYRKKYGHELSLHLNEIFAELKTVVASEKPGKDIEQQWKPAKGQILEEFINYLIEDGVKNLGLSITSGKLFEKNFESNSDETLAKLKRNLQVQFGNFGYYYPDVDLVVYDPETSRVIAVISCKTSLRERIAQTGFWKQKLNESAVTKHIKMYFITSDGDRIFSVNKKMSKPRAIAETAIDGTYVISTDQIQQSPKIKKFEQFFDDLKSHWESLKEKQNK